MTVTPEERARGAWESFLASNAIIDENSELTIVNCIASAIREAENETLENAALWCDGEAKTPSSAGAKAAGRREAGRRLGRVLRHIKHKET